MEAMNEQHLKDREENQQLTNLYKVICSLFKKILNVAYVSYILYNADKKYTTFSLLLKGILNIH